MCVSVRIYIHLYLYRETDHFAQVSTSLLSLMGEYTEIKKHCMPFIQYYKILVIIVPHFRSKAALKIYT